MRAWTQDEQVRFMRAALAEAGYPDADVRPNPGDEPCEHEAVWV